MPSITQGSWYCFYLLKSSLFSASDSELYEVFLDKIAGRCPMSGWKMENNGPTKSSAKEGRRRRERGVAPGIEVVSLCGSRVSRSLMRLRRGKNLLSSLCPNGWRQGMSCFTHANPARLDLHLIFRVHVTRLTICDCPRLSSLLSCPPMDKLDIHDSNVLFPNMCLLVACPLLHTSSKGLNQTRFPLSRGSKKMCGDGS